MAVLRPEGPKRRQARAEGRSRATTLSGVLSEQQYVVNGARILSTTGYSVKMKSWDEKAQRVKPHQTNAKKQTAAQINKYLNGVEGVVLDFENTCKMRPSQEQLKEVILSYHPDTDPDGEETLNEPRRPSVMHCFEEFTPDESLSSQWTHGTKQIWDAFKKHLEAVVKQQSFDFFNDDVIKAFTRNLRRMMQFAREFADLQIVSTLSTQLPWSAFLEVLPLEDALAREFYVTMAANERWSVRTLRDQMDGMLYERTLISRKPEEAIRSELSTVRQGGSISPELVFKSPYFLDFTGLKGYYSEKDLEDMIISGMQQFLMELGSGFSFVDRQKRMIIDGEDFYLDLLFYHRKLHRLVAIDLKKTKFKAAYKGQMELYLRWLDKYERQPGEERPLGLLLCAAGNDEQIQLLQLGDAGIQVSQYYTELPDKGLLKAQLQKQIAQAKLRLENKKE